MEDLVIKLGRDCRDVETGKSTGNGWSLSLDATNGLLLPSFGPLSFDTVTLDEEPPTGSDAAAD